MSRYVGTLMMILAVLTITAAVALCLFQKELANKYLPYCMTAILFFAVYILFYLFVHHTQRKMKKQEKE